MVIKRIQEPMTEPEITDKKPHGLTLTVDLMQNFHTPFTDELIGLEDENETLEQENTDLLEQLKHERVSARETLMEV